MLRLRQGYGACTLLWAGYFSIYFAHDIDNINTKDLVERELGCSYQELKELDIPRLVKVLYAAGITEKGAIRTIVEDIKYVILNPMFKETNLSTYKNLKKISKKSIDTFSNYIFININRTLEDGRKNLIDIDISKTLNKGIQYLFDNDKFTHFTWISDDNEYYPNFLNDLILNNTYFKYTSYDIQELDGSKCTNSKNYTDFNDILNNFNGCAAFMWTKDAIQKIGFYNETVPGCEDFEYLLRTFKKNDSESTFSNISTMKYVRHKDSLFFREKNFIIEQKKTILLIYKYFANNNSNLIYYSKTDFNLLFQRPHQIMRFFK